VHHAWRQGIRRPGQDARQLASKEAQSLPNSNATFQQKGARIWLMTGSPAVSHAVHRLKVQLIHGLGRNELHCRALHRFGMASASRKSFFCSFE
jgi:hypothetical protein